MKWIIRHLKKMSQEELCTLSSALDNELENREKRRVKRGHQRSSHFSDVVRGKRCALRWEQNLQKAA